MPAQLSYSKLHAAREMARAKAKLAEVAGDLTDRDRHLAEALSTHRRMDTTLLESIEDVRCLLDDIETCLSNLSDRLAENLLLRLYGVAFLLERDDHRACVQALRDMALDSADLVDENEKLVASAQARLVLAANAAPLFQH